MKPVWTLMRGGVPLVIAPTIVALVLDAHVGDAVETPFGNMFVVTDRYWRSGASHNEFHVIVLKMLLQSLAGNMSPVTITAETEFDRSYMP